MSRLLTFVVIVLLLTGCDGDYFATATPDAPPTATLWATNTPVVTAIPTEAPTPTPEGPEWSTDCVPAGIYPMNAEEASPCPANYDIVSFDGFKTQEIPAGMVLVVEPNTGDSIVPDIRYVDHAMRVYVYRVDGRVGVQIHGLELTGNHCYTLNTPVRWDMRGSNHYENFLFYSKIHTDRDTQFDLSKQWPVVPYNATTATETGENPGVFYAFQPSRDMTIVWEVGYQATWATASGGNYVDFLAFYVQDQDNTQNCD